MSDKLNPPTRVPKNPKLLKRICLFCVKKIKAGLYCNRYCHQQHNYIKIKITQVLIQVDTLNQNRLVHTTGFPEYKAIYGIQYGFRMTDKKRERLESWKEQIEDE